MKQNPSSHPTAVIAVINGTVYTEKPKFAPTVPENETPYERAMRFVERFTGKPRAEWESVLRHPFVQAADIIAKRLAGVKDKPEPPRRIPPHISVA